MEIFDLISTGLVAAGALYMVCRSVGRKKSSCCGCCSGTCEKKKQ